jgi:predicted transcriptional regulator
MEDFIKSIKAFLYDRASSPLFGALVTTWLTSNYKAVLISISNTDIEKKLALLSTYFNELSYHIELNLKYFQLSLDIPTWVARGIAYPIAATLAYIYLYPLVAEPVYQFSLSRQKRLRAIKQKAEDQKLLSQEESRAMFEQIHLAEAKYTTDLTRLNQENAQLKQTIQSLDSNPSREKNLISEINQLNSEVNRLKSQMLIVGEGNPAVAPDFQPVKMTDDSTLDDISADELEQLKYFASKSGNVLVDIVLNNSPFLQIKAKRLCASLLDKGFITLHNSGSVSYYQLTKKGEDLLLNSGSLNKKDVAPTMSRK